MIREEIDFYLLVIKNAVNDYKTNIFNNYEELNNLLYKSGLSLAYIETINKLDLLNKAFSTALDKTTTELIARIQNIKEHEKVQFQQNS